MYTGIVHKTDTNRPALPPQHLLDYVIPVLEDDSLGHTVIVAPPGSAKTNMMMAAVCWWLGRYSSEHVAFISCTATQATRRSKAIRDTIEQVPNYAAIFPQTRPNRDKGWAEREWFVTREDPSDKDPSMLALGVGGPLLGSRIDRCILDDIADSRNMNTRASQDKIQDWLERTLMTRITPRGRVIMICTRWSGNDPAAWAIKQGWHVVKIPAVSEEDESYWPDYWPMFKLACPDNKHGTVENQWCFETIESGKLIRGNCKKRAGSRAFVQQYQAEIVDDESSIFKRGWWKYYNRLPEGWENMRGGIFIDMAHQETSYSDYSVIGVMLTDNINYYLVDLKRLRAEFPQLKREIHLMHNKWPLFPIVIEQTPGSLPLLQSLRKELPQIFPWAIQGRSKLARAEAIVGFVEAGNCFLPADAPWAGDFTEELALFPSGEHDDMVDVFSMSMLSYQKIRITLGPAGKKRE